MNPISIANIILSLPNLILAAQQLLPASGTGAEKAAVVLGAVVPAIPDELAPSIVPQVKSWINLIVAGFNAWHPLFKKPTSPTA